MDKASIFLSFLLLFVHADYTYSEGLECPANWRNWNDQKCYLLVPAQLTFDQAKIRCSEKGGFLATIRDANQQAFLTEWIFNISDVSVDVWIGARRVANSLFTEFHWEVDESKLGYTNWATNFPTPVKERECVAMQSKYTRTDKEGKWKDITCSTATFFLCEYSPYINQDEIRTILMETKKKVEYLEKNPVPPGFIYTQLPGQLEPSKLWPMVKWKEITKSYAGLFFRALGGGSADFGKAQQDNSPRLVAVTHKKVNGRELGKGVLVESGKWSYDLISGDSDGSHVVGGSSIALSFYVSHGEVRPKNAAIRIWMREKEM